jgi:hypothetical protein
MVKFVMVSDNNTFIPHQFDEMIDYLTKDSLIEKCLVVQRTELTCTLWLEYQSKNKYLTEFTVSTYEATQRVVSQMVVSIEPQKIGEDYDPQLEHLKIQLKDWLLKSGIDAFGLLMNKFCSYLQNYTKICIELKIGHVNS